MIKYREILRLHAQNLSQRSIASSCSCSRNTVADVLKRANEKGVVWPFEVDLDDLRLQEILFPEKSKSNTRRMPDCEHTHREMAKSGVTLSLLWYEYCEECRRNKEIPYSYRQFCRFYTEYAATTKATMRIKRKPGELMEVDWAGQTATLKDNITGQSIPAYVFVGVLPCSQYAYVEAFLSMDTDSWITAHIHAFEFFGGIPRMIVPDNLKTGVTKASNFDPTLNRIYQEMAEHYQTVIMPARIRRPKDKPNVEGAVGVASTWIIASLRNQQFFSIIELNKAIKEKLSELNEKPFQKKSGSRLSAFLEEEKFALLPLPASIFELATWKKATVQYDYHIFIEKMYYSVPYEYIKHEVDARITKKIVEVFYNNFRIASHIRLLGKEGQLSTLPEHMPDHHKQYLDYNREYFLNWSDSVGYHTHVVVRGIFLSYKVEKQAIKSCMLLTKLADKYSLTRLESACRRALEYAPRPNVNMIKTILSTGQDRYDLDPSINAKEVNKQQNSHGFTRGAEYYGRKEK